MIDESMGMEEPCPSCGMDPADCICPECPVCGAQGDPVCYNQDVNNNRNHSINYLFYNKAQRMGQSRLKIAQLKEQIADEEQYMAWLEDQPEDWKDEA
jgi:hypothetical protein